MNTHGLLEIGIHTMHTQDIAN